MDINSPIGPPSRIEVPPPTLREVYRKLEPPPLKKQLRDALDFQFICGARLTRPLLTLWAGVFLLLVPTLILFGALGWLGMVLHFRTAARHVESWPFLLKLAILLGGCATGWILAAGSLATFRVVQRVRQIGRLRKGQLWKETGTAVETIGFIGTIGWILCLGAAAGLMVLLHHGLTLLLAYATFIPPSLATALTLAITLAFAWLAIFLPQLYVMAVLARRDCGWLRAFGVSATFVYLEGPKALPKSILASLAILTIIGIPFATALTLATVDKLELILAYILAEKPGKEVREELEQQESTLKSALKRHFQSLENGRYLDALNGFQMYLRTHREDLDALRGESIALLHIGNPRARESLERWARLDPEADEPLQLLTELNEGLWADNGARFGEAQRRSRQHIGRGI